MPTIILAQQELDFAKEALATFADNRLQERGWFDFILHLDLCFIKAERECQDIRNKFEPFQGTFKALRRKDPLLSYLKNARDAINHSIVSGIDYSMIENAEPIPIAIGFGLEGEIHTWKEVLGSPIELKLQPIEINGQIWQSPTQHLGKALIGDRDPLEVANLAIEFYQNFLDQIKKKFITP